MIISANLTELRQLFSAPDTFIAKAVEVGRTFNYSGWNIDFEPDGSIEPTNRDAVAYTGFLTKLANSLHSANLQLTVDYDEWSPIWNLTLLAKTPVDFFMAMGTYNYEWKYFQERLDHGITAFGTKRLVVGLETTHPGQFARLRRNVTRC